MGGYTIHFGRRVRKYQRLMSPPHPLLPTSPRMASLKLLWTQHMRSWSTLKSRKKWTRKPPKRASNRFRLQRTKSHKCLKWSKPQTKRWRRRMHRQPDRKLLRKSGMQPHMRSRRTQAVLRSSRHKRSRKEPAQGPTQQVADKTSGQCQSVSSLEY